jgi:uncharacterized protein (DUF58 family)
MRDALHGLTTRGRCFLAAGIACVLCGFVLGQRDLVRVGLLLVALPLVAAAVVQRTRYRLACQRLVDPARIEAGRPGRVLLRLSNVSRLPIGVLLIEDTLPYPLGARPRFVLNRLEPQGVREVSYAVRSDVRGKYTIGPLSLRLTDPFGMCELARSFTATDTLVVTPVVWPLPPGRVVGGWNGSGESRARSIAASGDDDVATRQYRQGDDLRRIHWRTTARTGDLMVRREEQPWQASAVLMLDNRAGAHRGDGPGSSFEYACSAVASIGAHLLRNGFSLRLGPGLVDPRVASADVTADQTTLFDQLAVAGVARTGLLPGVDGWRYVGGIFVAVLGALTVDEATRLVSAAHNSGTNLAVCLDTASWTSQAPRVRAESLDRLAASVAVLRGAGWRVVTPGHGSSLADVWPQLATVGVTGSAPPPLDATTVAEQRPGDGQSSSHDPRTGLRTAR